MPNDDQIFCRSKQKSITKEKNPPVNLDGKTFRMAATVQLHREKLLLFPALKEKVVFPQNNKRLLEPSAS